MARLTRIDVGKYGLCEGGRRHPFLGFGLGTAAEAGRFYEPPQRRADPAETEKRYSLKTDPEECPVAIYLIDDHEKG